MIAPFPKDSVLISGAFEVFNGTRESLLIFVPLVLSVRILINMITLKGSVHYIDVIRDTILFFFGVFCLESLMLLIVQIPANAGELIGSKEPVVLDNIPDKFYLFSLALGMSDFVDYLTGLVFHVISIIYLMLMSLAIMLGGYIIFFATLFQIRKAFTVFIMLVFFLSLWPFVWYSIDRTFEHILKVHNQNGSAMGTVVTMFILSLMKLMIPVLGFIGALKAPVGMFGIAAQSVKNGLSPLNSAANFGLRSTQKTANIFGADKTLSYLSSPLKNKITSGISQTRSKLKDSAPFAAYSMDKLLGRKSSIGGFKNYKANMAKAIAKSKSARSDVLKENHNHKLTRADSSSSFKSTGSSIKKRDYIPNTEFKSIQKFVRENGIENIDKFQGGKSKKLKKFVSDYKTYQQNISVRSERNMHQSRLV